MKNYLLDLLHNATYSTGDLVWLAHINRQGDARAVLSAIFQLQEAGEIVGSDDGWERVYKPEPVIAPKPAQRQLAGMED